MVIEKVINYLNPRRAVLLFVALNFLFLIVDILVAHSYNHFEVPAEWVPVVYSAVAGAALLIYALIEQPSRIFKTLMHFILWIGVLVGVVGFFLHFKGATFREFSLKSLVYAAPLVAPFAYSGLAFVALFTDGFCAHFGEYRKRILFFLTGAGFLGNFLLSVFDHARNGFFVTTEWVPVFVAAFTCVVLFWAAFKKSLSFEDAVTVHLALGLAILTGLIGFVLHLVADLHSLMPDFKDKFIYGAPIFAPLLFCDIAFLGVLAALMRDDFKGWLQNHLS